MTDYTDELYEKTPPTTAPAFSGNGHHPQAGPPEPGDPPDELHDTQDINAFLLSQPGDHEGQAQCVLKLHPGKFLFCDAYGWLYYNGAYWQAENAQALIERAIVDTLIERRVLAVKTDREPLVKSCKANAGTVKGTLTLLQSLQAVSVDQFDNTPDLLNVANGVLELRTGALTPHDSRQRFTYACPVEYDPQADTSAWLNFLNEATDSETVDFLQAAIGYSLTGHTWEEIMFYLYGPTRSGKGTFTETLLRTFGRILAIEADFTSFTAPRLGDTQNFDLAPLKPCRFVAAAESDKHTPLNPAKIKQLTGGNHVRCAFKHRDHFTYRPQFKIWLTSNHPVNVDVDDDAAWGRMRVITFPTSHLDHEDKTLKQRLQQPSNLRGVLRWAVEGAGRWYQAGLPYPDNLRAEAQAQRDARDYVAQFLEECTDPTGWILSSNLWGAYETWCKENGVTAKYRNHFTQAIERAGYLCKRGRIENRLVRFFHGISLKKCDV